MFWRMQSRKKISQIHRIGNLLHEVKKSGDRYMIKKEVISKLLNRIIGVEINENEYNESLYEKGFSSLLFIQFIVLVEEDYNIEILDDDLQYEKFESVDKIYETVNKYVK